MDCNQCLELILEGEDPAKFKDHLGNCKECKKELEHFQTQNIVLKNIDLKMPTEDHFARSLNSIMANIEKLDSIKNRPRRRYAMIAAGVVIAVMSTLITGRIFDKPAEKKELDFVQLARTEPDLLKELPFDEYEVDDVVLAMASQNADRYSPQELLELFDVKDRK